MTSKKRVEHTQALVFFMLSIVTGTYCVISIMEASTNTMSTLIILLFWFISFGLLVHFQKMFKEKILVTLALVIFGGWLALKDFTLNGTDWFLILSISVLTLILQVSRPLKSNKN